MIFRRALLREMTSNALLVFSVLMMITLTTMLIRYLGQAASGAVANEAVAAFLGFSIINYLPVLLSLTVFIAVLMTLTRCYRDSEMVVWFCSGLSVSAWVRPVIAFVLPVIFAIAFLSLVVSPWALRKSDEYRLQMDNRDDVSSVAPGVFKESKFAERVYFVESFAGANNTVSNIFMRSMQHQKLGILVAQNGYQTVAENGDRFLMLLNGRRYEGLGGSPEFKIMAFERYATRIQPYEAGQVVLSQKALSTWMLLGDPSAVNMGELLWRVGLPLSAFILALLAIPLSFVNPRAGRSLNLILALLLYMVYNNFISITQAWVAQSKLSPYVGLWLAHVVMLLVLLILFYRRLVLLPIWTIWLRRLISLSGGNRA